MSRHPRRLGYEYPACSEGRPANYSIHDIAIVASVRSRKGRQAAAMIRDAFGAEAALFATADTGEELFSAIAKAKEVGANVVAVTGGDGTMGMVAEKCAQHDLTLGIIPTGTGNALAHELRIPIDPVAAVRMMTDNALERRIDVASFNDQTYLTVATFGITSRIAEYLPKVGKGRLGLIAYLPALIRAMRQPHPIWIRVQTPGGDFEGFVYEFVAAATRFHGGPFPVTENAAIDDGLLSVYAVRATEHHSLARYGLGLLSGRQTALPEVWYVDTPEVAVTARGEGNVVLDGNPRLASGGQLRIAKQNLRVLAPCPKPNIVRPELTVPHIPRH